MPGNVPSAATNSFSPNTKAKSAEVNTNFTENVSWHSSFSYDAKHGTVFLQTSAKSADYTVLDTDGIYTILMTTGASNRTVTLPTAADNNGRILVVKKVDSGAGYCIIDGEGSETVDGSTTITLTDINEFATVQCNGTAWYVIDRTGPTSPGDQDNYTLTASVAASALTIALKTKAGNDPSVADPVRLSFRSATAATGDYSTAYATAATSLVISSGSTLGHSSGLSSYIWVYAINNSGTVELACSTTPFSEGSIASSTAEGGAGGADSGTLLYSTTARTNKGIRFLGRMLSTQATAGTWASSMTEISLSNVFVPPNGQVRVANGNGHGSTNTCIRRWTNTTASVGTAITYADSAANGGSFTINEAGVYAVTYADRSTGTGYLGISLNSTQLTTSIDSITAVDRYGFAYVAAANHQEFVTALIFCRIGDVIRAHDDGSMDNTGVFSFFSVTQVSRIA